MYNVARFVISMIKLQNIGGQEYIFDRYREKCVKSAMNNDYWEKFEENLRFGIEYIIKLCFRLNIFCVN